MHIEINGDAERLIQAGLASGQFHSAEEVVAAMAHVWADSHLNLNQIPTLTTSSNIEQLALQQGVQPFNSTFSKPDFWPNEESADDFLKFLNDVRRDATG